MSHPLKTALPLSVAAYAKRLGVTRRAVDRAIEGGRLAGSVVRVGGKPKIADPALADREWRARTRPRADRQQVAPAHAPPPSGAQPTPPPLPDPDSYAEARRRREQELYLQALIRRQADELDLAKRRGELVDATAARAAISEKLLAVRTRLLAVPARAKQRMPHLSPVDVAELEGLIYEALEELAGPVAGG